VIPSRSRVLWLRPLRVVLLALGLVLLGGTPAAADAPAPTDFRSEVTAVVPETDVIDVSIVGGDGFLLLEVDEGHTAVGDLRVDSASILGVSDFENIRKPDRVQNEIYVQMEGNENRKFDRVSDGINATLGAQQPPQHPPPQSITDQIGKLGELRDRGVLSEEEFQAKKAELLQRM